MINEKLKVSDGIGAWIKDFMKSDAPQFQGKSMDQRRKMAIAAFADAGGNLKEDKMMEIPSSSYLNVGQYLYDSQENI